MSILPEELAMVTDAVADFSIEDYIKAITTLVHELVYATRSFNNKYVLFFVSSEESAKLLRTNHRKINIKGRELEIKPIEYSKIKFCEVPDAICDNDIKRELEKLNINLFSEIQNQSYDKIVYIHPSDNEAIGISIQCKSYQISVRRHMICSLCHDRIHNALNCPDAKEGQNTAGNSNDRTGDRIPLALQKSATDSNPNAPDTVIAGCSKDKEPRPITKTSTSTSRELTHYNSIPNNKDNPHRNKQTDSNTVEEVNNDPELVPFIIALSEKELIIKESNSLNLRELVSFLKETKGRPSKALEIARTYTNDIEGLINMMERIRKLKDRNIAGQLKNLVQVLKNQLDIEQTKNEIKKRQSES